MRAGVPKQYLRFQNKSILEHTLDRLFALPELDGVMLVINAADSHWQTLDYQAPKELHLTKGGAERTHSVLNGLQALEVFLKDDALILVHDAVRPLVTVDEMSRVLKAAESGDHGALLAVPVADTLKKQSDNQQVVEQTIAREKLWRAQTPQVFKLKCLLEALEESINRGNLVSDDSAAMEQSGYQPRLVMGSGSNIKITLPEDLAIAEQTWLYQRNQQDDE